MESKTSDLRFSTRNRRLAIDKFLIDLINVKNSAQGKVENP